MDKATEQQNNKRIAKNTLLLYFRMLLTMGVGLYTSRVILDTLGVENFGTYNAVAGVVALFSMLSGALSSAISRFFTFELGKGNKERLRIVFSSAITIQIFFSFIIVVLAESIGIWFLNAKMSIPEHSVWAANWVFQLSLVTFCINLVSVPYNAAIIAHERMSAFAYVSIFEALGKLGIAWAILLSPMDKLVFYSVLMMLLPLLIRCIYGVYCKKHFDECHFKFIFESDVLKKMFGFAGWNTLGQIAYVFNTQGINLLINLFFGVGLNAARGIAVQVDNIVNTFLNNFIIALNPQITKSYASGNLSYMMKLVEAGAKLGFYLTMVLVVPLFFQSDFLLRLWLKEVPDCTSIFVRLILLYTLIQSLSQTLFTSLLATGDIKKYQISVGGMLILVLPVTYVLYKMGLGPEYCYYTLIIFAMICLWIRLILLKMMIGLSISSFVKNVLLRTMPVFGIVFCCTWFVDYNVDDFSGKHFFVVICSVFLSFGTILLVGLTKEERSLVGSFAKRVIGKMR